MAAITVTGAIVDPNGTVPDSGGTIEFLLNQSYRRNDGKMAVPKPESASVSAVDGSFSLQLESTRDGVPSSTFYRVMFRGKFGGAPVNYELGRVQIRNTPSSQTIQDLLQDALISETTGRRKRDSSADGTLSGAVDGSNTIFSLSRLPILGSEEGFVNELYQVPGVNYTISGQQITITPPPLATDRVTFYYDLA